MSSKRWTMPFEYLPLEIWHMIVIHIPLNWLRVSRYWSLFAAENICNDPRVNPAAKDNFPLRMAVQKRKVDLVRRLLRSPQVNPAIFRNWPLRFAAAIGWPDIVELLLEHPSVDPSAESNESLIYAGRNGRDEVALLLLNHPRIDPSFGNNAALKEAICSHSPAIIRAIINHPRYTPMDRWEFTTAQKGLLRGNADVTKIITELDATVAGLGSELLGDIPDAESVKVLVQAGADPSVLRHRLIRNAVVYRRHDLVQYLLTDPRADPAAQTNWCIAFAAEAGDERMVAMLLADPRVDPAARGNYALRFACERGHLSIVKMLLQDARVHPGLGEYKALTHAVMNPLPATPSYFKKESKRDYDNVMPQKVAIVELLLEDPRVDPTWNNNLALEIALADGSRKIALLLTDNPLVNPRDVALDTIIEEFAQKEGAERSLVVANLLTCQIN